MEEQVTIELFVNEEESSTLEKIALGEAPFSQRAQAILAVDAGSNLKQAALVAGLRVTQVRYWVNRFNNSRLDVFPEAMIAKIKERQSLKTGAEKVTMEKEKTKASKKKSKNGEPKAKKKDKQNKKKKGDKKKADLTKSGKKKKTKDVSKDKSTKKGKKGKKQKKKK